MNTHADPLALPNLTYATCTKVVAMGPPFMATFAAIAEFRIKRLCHARPSSTGTAGQAALPLPNQTSSPSS